MKSSNSHKQSVRVFAPFILSFFSLSLCHPLHSQQQPSPETKLVLLSPSDTAFRTVLHDNFPTVASAAHFDDISNLCVIIRNDGTTPLTAFAVVWDITDSGGNHSRADQIALTRSGASTFVTGKKPELGAGSMELVSPWFRWAIADTPNITKLTTLFSTYSSTSLARQSHEAMQIVPTLDSAIQSGLQSSGPDTTKLRILYRIDRNAQHDEGVSVLRLIATGISDADLASQLEKHALRTSSPPLTPDKQAYTKARATEARLLLTLFRSRGRDSLIIVATKLRNMPRTS